MAFALALVCLGGGFAFADGGERPFFRNGSVDYERLANNRWQRYVQYRTHLDGQNRIGRQNDYRKQRKSYRARQLGVHNGAFGAFVHFEREINLNYAA